MEQMHWTHRHTTLMVSDFINVLINNTRRKLYTIFYFILTYFILLNVFKYKYSLILTFWVWTYFKTHINFVFTSSKLFCEE